jgi:hypothetical protein
MRSLMHSSSNFRLILLHTVTHVIIRPDCRSVVSASQEMPRHRKTSHSCWASSDDGMLMNVKVPALILDGAELRYRLLSGWNHSPQLNRAHTGLGFHLEAR